MAKTDWTMNDEVKPSDMNQIGTEINELRDDIDNIPAASTTQAGITKLNNSTTGTSQTEAATPKAVNDARLAAISAAATDATTKASAAETNARTYVDAKTWQKYKLTQDNGSAIYKGTIDANTLTAGGVYSVFSNSTNIPSPTDFFITVSTFTEGGKLIIKQIAVPFGSSGYYQRHYYSDAGFWSPWSQDVFQSGVDAKNGIVDAINANGGNASTSDTWAVLAQKIQTVSSFKSGDHLMVSVDNSGGTSNTSMTRIRSIKPSIGGTYKVGFRLTVGSTITGAAGYGRIYVNGVPRGTERRVDNNGTAFFEEDITIGTGDAIEIYGRSTNSQNSISFPSIQLKINFSAAVTY